MSGSVQCPHFNFSATVNIARIEDTGLKYAHLTIACTDCGRLAQFRGLACGLPPDKPMASPDGQEVRLPFRCEGDAYNGKGIGFAFHRGEA